MTLLRILWLWRQKVGRTCSIFLCALLLLLSLNVVYLWFSPFDLSGDEAHYWEWSRRPALGYYSKGPMVAYVIYASTHILGHSTFAVRLPAVLFSAATLGLVFLLTLRVFRSEAAALLAALLLAASPMINVGATIMTIDVLVCFFSIAALVLLWRAIESGALGVWAMAGTVTALAILSKFTAIALLPGLLAFLALSRRDRSLLRTPHPYVYMLISMLAFVPVVIWNASHDWVTFRHLFALGKVNSPAFVNVTWLPDFVFWQMLAMTPLIFATILWGACMSVARALGRVPLPVAGDSDVAANAEDRRGHLFVQSFALPVFLFYLVLSLHQRILPNWPALGYFPAAAAAGAVIAERLQGPNRRFWRIWLAVCIGLGLTVSLAGRFPSVLYAVGASPARLPSARLEGWRELGECVGRIVSDMGGESKVFIFSESYQIAGQVAFYTEGHPVTYCEPRFGRRLNQYDFWPGCGDFVGKNGVYVGKMSSQVRESLESAFASVVEQPALEVRRGGAVIRTFRIAKCYGLKGFPKMPVATKY